MKHPIISGALLCMAALPATAVAQSINFETQDYKSIGVYDTWENSPFRKGQLQGNVAVVDNHLTAMDSVLSIVPNSSAKILGFQRSRYGSNTFGARIDLKETFELTPETKYVHVLINKPVSGRVMLIGLGKRKDRAGQNAETEQFWVFSNNTVTPDQWCDAVFPIKGAGGIDIYSLVVVPDAESSHTRSADFACYIDKIVVNDKSTSDIEREDYPTSFKKDQTYTRGDRGLKAVKLQASTINVAASITKGKTPVYSDLTSKQFQVKPGQTVTPAFDYSGTWMSGYVYLDYGRDGKFSYDIQANGKPDNSDLVTYSFYKNKNSKGTSVNNGNTLVQPSFTIPANLPIGFYRMRYKVDWDNIDPRGNASHDNNIVNNGGAIVDVRLNVHGDSVNVNDANRNGEVLAAGGSKLNSYRIPFGKSFTIKMNPERGFTYSGIRLRHGYNLAGDSLVHSTPQYEDVIFRKSQFKKDDTFTIPAIYVDGDLEIEGLFISSTSTVVNDYPVNFDKATKRTRTDRVLNGVGLGEIAHNVANTELMYHNLTSKSFIARQGSTVKPFVNYSAGWMNAYVYLDKEQDGDFNVEEVGAKGALTESTDLVSFSGLTLSDQTRYNSAGTQLDNLNTLNTPAFKIPENLADGFYLMRYKVDWDSADPAGRIDEQNNIVNNGGAIADIRVLVTKREKVTAKVFSNHGLLTAFNGKDLNNAELPLGKGLTVLAKSEKGYKLTGLRLRHGILGGDSIANKVAQYVDTYFSANDLKGGMLQLNGGYVDGDLEFYPTFEPATAEEEAAGEYILVFDDEFNQPNGTQPDPARWTRSVRYGAAWNRWISNSNDVIFCQDSCLVARAIPNPDKSTDNVDMLTGAVETRGLYSFTYGKVEVRLRTNPHRGNFPAAWMMPQPPAEGWPKAGEIDIFETIDTQNRAYHTIHSNWTYTLGNKNNPQSGFNEAVNVADWHVYGVEWDAERITWTVDGQEVGSYAKSTDQNALDNGQWPFTKPFYLILNQSVGNGSWAANPDVNHVYETRFDYIRVYQKVPTTGIIEVTPNANNSNVVYDLSGRRVNNPSKGLYIVNGKKVYIK